MKKMIIFAVLAMAGELRAQRISRLNIPNLTPSEIAAGVPAPGPAEIARPRPFKVVDGKFAGLAAASIGAAAGDVALAHRCVTAGSCRELNPFMQRGAAGFAVGIGTTALANAAGYELRRRGSSPWFVPQAIAAGIHAVGIATDLRGSR